MLETDGPSFSLAGKVVLQFGGSGLLGRALVSDLAAAGTTLVVASRQVTALPVPSGATRDRVHFEKVDLLNETSIRDLVGRVQTKHGRLDGMVYNAVNRPMTKGFNDDLSKWEESMRLNATGFFAIGRFTALY